MESEHIFNALADVNWLTAGRTFGNSHATLIGLLVDWWIRLNPKHTVLEASPSCNSISITGEGHAYCDALLCDGDVPVGIIEVEGIKQAATAKKLARFFKSTAPDLRTIQFAILLLYRTEPQGRADKREFPLAVSDDGRKEAVAASSGCPSKDVFLIGLEKKRQRNVSDIRRRKSYYSGTVTSVHAEWLRSGQSSRKAKLFAP